MTRYMITFLLVVIGTVNLGVTQSTGFCDYPTYYDSVSGECVSTCPAGTIGNVSRTTNVTMRNCTSLLTGYNITFNATEYEFDISVYSTVGTVVFDALLIVENFDALVVITVSSSGFPLYSINEADTQVVFELPRTNPLLTITLSEVLNLDDENVDYNFTIHYDAVIDTGSVNVILHEIDPCDDCPVNSTCEPQSDGSVVCTCPAGYSGTNCENFIGFCLPNPCVNGGTCVDTGLNFTCSCLSPLTGNICEVDPVDECSPNPCVNGNCTDLISSYNCTCFDGFTDQDCSTNINDCDPNPCMNNGSCIDSVNTFTCNCTSPWIGRVCNIDGIDDCIGVDCNNGTCVDQVSGFQCNCSSGYTGRFCEINIDDCEGVTCLNNGTCMDHINDFTCQCSPGYEGRFCSYTTNECDPDPCVSGQGDCEDLFLDYRCNCRPDFTGRNCSARFNDCLSDPCQNNATCYDLFASYRCDCPDGVTGSDCEDIIDQCDPNPCVNNGTCTSVINNYTCTCPTGYTSRNCSLKSDIIDFCMGAVCVNNGTCVNMPSVGNYSCMCSDGFTGRNCESNIDDCIPNPCENNGACIDLVNGFLCNCVEGFTEKNCSSNIDDCTPNPCENNGTCADLVNDFMCSCAEGFNGKNCSNNTDDCIPNPCENNGTCMDLVNDYMCNCVEGFTEKNCSTNIDDCTPGSCENNGTCTDLVNDYACDCVEGFTGRNCSTNINDCTPNPCVNNATCTDLVNDYMCVCIEGFTEKNCITAIDDCTPNPCENNGNCTDLVNDFMCSCVEGFNGKNCSNNIDDCIPNPCENDGNCTDLVNNFMCNCISGFTGRNCSTNIDDCSPNPCENNGNCTDLENDYKCNCAEGFTGTNCSTNISNCTLNSCENNGTCIGCPRDTDAWNIEWPSIRAGDISCQLCPGSQGLIATRECSEVGVWNSPDVSKCQSTEYTDLEGEVERITSTAVNITTLIMFTSELSNITSAQQEAILPQDVVTANNILTMIIDSALNVTDANEIEIVTLSNHAAVVLDNLLSDSNDPSFQQLTDQGNTTNQLLSNTENVGVLLAKSLDNSSNKSVNDAIIKTNIAINVTLPTEEELMTFDDIVFPEEFEIVSNSTDVINQAQIIIPGSIILHQFEIEGKRVPVINVFSKNINMRLPNNMERHSPVGITISSQISDTPMNRIEFPDNNVVTMKFKIESSPSNLSATCVFWDFTNEGWSTDGVSTQPIDRNTVQCTTTHLTSFSVLVGPSGSEPTSDEEVLSYISYIGCGISIVCLLLTMIALVVFRKSIFNQIQCFIHFNLSLSLLLGLIIFVAGIEAANDSEGGCKFVAFLLHYTFLSAFCWMLCEGVVIYILLYFVFYKGFFLNWKFYTALGYGLPLPIVLISFGAAFDNYGTDEICWLSEENGAIWAFIVPMLLIILINIFIFIATLWRVYKTMEVHLTAEQHKKAKTAKSLMKAAVVLQPLLGCTWIIGLFTVNRNTIAFAYVFTILNVLQGVLIFCFYILRNEKIIAMIKTCGKGEKHTTKHTITHTGSYIAGSTNTTVKYSSSSLHETFLRKQKSGANYDVTIRNNYIKEDDEVSQKPSDSDAPLKKQKSWTDYDAVVKNIYVKEDDEVSQKPSDSPETATNDMLEFHSPSTAAQKSDNDDATIMNDDTQDNASTVITVVLVHRGSVTEDTKL